MPFAGRFAQVSLWVVRTELLQVQFPHLLHQGVVQLVQERPHVHLLQQLEPREPS